MPSTWRSEPPPGGFAQDPRRLEWTLSAGVLVITVAVTFWRVPAILIQQWSTNDTYSFGALVPLISAYFIWAQRHRLAAMTFAPGIWIGALLVSVCGILLAAGRAIGVIGLQEIAMVLMVPAGVWLLCGRRYVFALWFPLLYLLLMLPVWEILTDRFHYRSQLFSALVGEHLLSAARIPVHRSDTYLELPNITLEVASVCSGINFLIAVIAMGVPHAYLFLKGVMPRAIVIAFAIAIALFSNGLRVAIIGLLSYYELTRNIHGPGHLLQGMFVSAVGLIAVHAAVMLMARRYPRPRQQTVSAAPPGASLPRWRLFGAVAAACAVVLAAGRLHPSGLTGSIASADAPSPLVSKWHLLRASVPMPFVTGGSGPNLGRTFMTAPSRTVDVFAGPLVYVEPAGALGYRQVALPAQTALSEMPVPTSTGTIFVNRVSFRRGDHQTDLAFWYDMNGAVTSQVTTAKLATLWGLVTDKRPLPVLVVVTRTRNSGSSEPSEPIEGTVADVYDALQADAHTAAPAQRNDEP
jgi:exosortase